MNQGKKAKCRVCSILILLLLFIIIFFFAFNYLTYIFVHKEITGKNIALRDPEQKYDVLLVGSSHTGSIQTCELWRRHGIAAYNGYHDGTCMQLVNTYIQLDLQYCTPKVVVIDTEHWWDEWGTEEHFNTYHNTLDVYPMTMKKAVLLYKLLPEARKLKELYNPLYVFHDRWKSLNQEDFIPTDEYQGSCPGLNIFELPDIETNLSADDIDESVYPEYVEQVIQTCQSQGISVILTCYPYRGTISEQRKQNAIFKLAEKYQIPYLNFMNYAGLLNYQTDFKDAGHLNQLGAAKCYDLLSESILQTGKVKDRRPDEAYAGIWNKNVENYLLALKEEATNQNRAITNLTLFGTEGFYGDIIVNDSILLYDPTLYGMFTELLKRQEGEAADLSLVYRCMNGEPYVLAKKADGSILQYAGQEAAAYIDKLAKESEYPEKYKNAGLVRLCFSSTGEVISEGVIEGDSLGVEHP